MLRKLSLAIAVSWATNAMAVDSPAPVSNQNGLVSVYQEAVDNNADLAAARASYSAQKEVVPQARAGLLPNLSGGAESSSVRTSIDRPSMTTNRSAMVYQATLAQPLFRIDRWFQLKAAESINEQAALHGRTFRVYASADRFGVELGGALKNVYAIIAGMAVADQQYMSKLYAAAAPAQLQVRCAALLPYGLTMSATARRPDCR